MKGIFLLTFRYLSHHKIKTTIMVTCLTITIVLPLSLHLMIDRYRYDLVSRAKTTPLVIGAKGNRYDLVTKTLYFTEHGPEPVTMSEVDYVNNTGRAFALPVHAGFTARNYPVVGTVLDYFEFRGLKIARGKLPARLGQAVLGAEVAAETGLGPGDTILTDQTNLYDLAAAYPLKMHVNGVLAPAGSPDDRAVFVDIKTAWVIEGIGHGHANLAETDDPSSLLKKNGNEYVASPAIEKYTEITDENISSFHFHGDRSGFPVTAVIVLPCSEKSATILLGHYSTTPDTQMLVPIRVIEDLMGIVFKAKKFFEANFALVALATVLFLVLVVMLSLRIRRSEMETLFRIGCSRMTVFRLQVIELLLVLGASVFISSLVAVLLMCLAPDVVKVM